MNIMNKKNRIIFAIILLLQLAFLSNVNADDTQEIDDEELPAIDPFGTGATSQDASGDTTQGFGVSSSVINNMKLVGTISGAHEKLAILSMPDGRALKFGENEFISDDIQVVEIYNDLIVIRVNSEEEFEVYMNNKIKPREGN